MAKKANTKVKTNRKGKGLLSKINFTSRRTQFLVVILLVAVLGGGWFTYRSFAAVDPNTIVFRASYFRAGVDTMDGTSNKAGEKYLSVYTGQEYYTHGITVRSTGAYRPCVMIQPIYANTNLTMTLVRSEVDLYTDPSNYTQFITKDATHSSISAGRPDGSNYRRVCSNKTTYLKYADLVHFQISSTKNTRITYAYLEKVTIPSIKK